MNIKNWKLSYKLTITLLIAGLLPLFIAGVIVNNKASQALEKTEYNLLESARDTKKVYIEDYFNSIKNQAITFSENRMIIDAMNSFKTSFHSSDVDNMTQDDLTEMSKKTKSFYQNEFNNLYSEKNGTNANIAAMLPNDKKSMVYQHHYIANNEHPLGSKNNLVSSADVNRYYNRAHEQYHPIIANYLDKFGYYDIFLVDADSGHIVYSVFKELDYATSLKTGPYKNTHFADVYNRALSGNKGTAFIADFKPYAPSYEAAASFIASPIYDGDTLEGVLIFQMPVGHINDIMQTRAGLGETGETYLVGNDMLMRSQSHFIEEDTIGKKTINSASVVEALAGKTGDHVIDDYRGIAVASSYTPVNIDGLDWVLIAEMDEAEAFASVVELRNLLIIISCISLFAIIGLALLFTRSVLKQLGADPRELSHVVSEIADGNLDLTINTKEKDSASVLSSMKTMQEKLKGTITNINEAASTITVAAKEISAGNIDLSQRTEKQAASLEETASSMEELTSTVKQNAENAQQANQLANGASEIAVKGGDVVEKVVTTMSDINESSSKIVDIISVIDGIAFQTNILALNAAVEAARAGEQGRGFAVVAAEVRSLAQRSAGAAKEIKTLIDASVDKVETGAALVDEAGTTMNEIVTSVKRVTDIMAEISAASMEQSTGINQVNVAITQMDDVTQQNAALVEEAAAGAESLEEQAQILSDSMSAFKLSSDSSVHHSKPNLVRPTLASSTAAAPRAPVRKLQAPSPTDDDEWEEF